MAYYRDGQKHPTAIWECAAMHFLVRVRCRQPHCTNTATYDPHEVWALFHKRGWIDEFRVAQLRFYCRVCSSLAGFRVKNALMSSLGACDGDITHTLPIRPDEREWKNFLNRHRG